MIAVQKFCTSTLSFSEPWNFRRSGLLAPATDFPLYLTQCGHLQQQGGPKLLKIVTTEFCQKQLRSNCVFDSVHELTDLKSFWSKQSIQSELARFSKNLNFYTNLASVPLSLKEPQNNSGWSTSIVLNDCFKLLYFTWVILFPVLSTH